jgi:hypothetical protein
MWEAFRAPEFQPIGRSETKRAKERLEELSTATECVANEVNQIGKDGQLEGMWLAYRNRRPMLSQLLPGDLLSIATALHGLSDFFLRAAALYKPEGPVPPVGQPRDHDALKTTVIRQIAQVCKRHFGTPMYSTAATLANAALERDDIDDRIVQGSLRTLA